jgi:hypothetical protein
VDLPLPPAAEAYLLDAQVARYTEIMRVFAEAWFEADSAAEADDGAAPEQPYVR